MKKRPARVAILAYHEIVDDGKIESLTPILQKGYIVEKTIFENQMRYLADNGFTAPVISGFGTSAAGSRKVYITFDDGYLGNHTYALPILKKYGLKATFFITTGWIGKKHMMDWDHIRDLLKEGMEIGSHTRSHVLLENCRPEELAEQLRLSREDIRINTGVTPGSISYPNGSYSRNVLECSVRQGYRLSLTSDFGYEKDDSPAKNLKRIFARNSVGHFKAIVSRDLKFYIAARIHGTLTGSLKILLGRANYDNLYNKLFGVNLKK